ncbi:MAG: dephospho-CoA kinase [Methylotenera sp.]|uniref:dephospho-CoA kinase n=1 Tax=Methylotenera sp. TaxID=2051956 RepID=UPI00248741D0|nr:dephospho-CoA kinase [Methylotenera sp.]MDI1310239.1 dephospho-CoA kinase [Methylotenera sp.]
MIVALTGGIGSGKSEAARQFAALGVPIVDADVIAHELTAAGQPILTEIGHIFGSDTLNIDGSLDRAELREHVFNNPAERLKLEALIHPAIHKQALKQLADNELRLHPAYQILVIPLLFENNRYSGVADKILVIDCDESIQIQRAMARSNISESNVKDMIKAQVARNVRLDSADEIIVNDGTLAELQEKVIRIHKKLIRTCIVSK